MYVYIPTAYSINKYNLSFLNYVCVNIDFRKSQKNWRNDSMLINFYSDMCKDWDSSRFGITGLNSINWKWNLSVVVFVDKKVYLIKIISFLVDPKVII